MRVLLAILVLVQVCGCQYEDNDETIDKIFCFKSFDLFKLVAGDTLLHSRGNNFVRVAYDSTCFPIIIEYHLPDTEIKLIFEDSFKLETGQIVYAFSTSNLFGGPPGKHHVYSFHYEEYKQIVYSCLSDTLLCQMENVPKDLNFSFKLFIRDANDRIYRVQQGESDYDKTNSKLSTSGLYTKWKNRLVYSYLRDSLVSGPETDLPFTQMSD